MWCRQQHQQYSLTGIFQEYLQLDICAKEMPQHTSFRGSSARHNTYINVPSAVSLYKYAEIIDTEESEAQKLLNSSDSTEYILL